MYKVQQKKKNIHCICFLKEFKSTIIMFIGFFFKGAVAGENVTSLTLSAAGGGERWGVVNFLAPPSQKSIDNLKGVVKAMSVISF